MAFLLGVVKELDHILFGPVVGNGACLPVQHYGSVSDGEQVGTRVVDLHSTAILQQEEIEKGGNM